MAQHSPVFILFIVQFYFILFNFVDCDDSNNIELNSSSDLSFSKYHDYSEMTDFLKKFVIENKDLARLYSIGRSVRKKELWVVEVHNMTQKPVLGTPQVKIIGNIHGDETAGREVILHFIEYLVKSYNQGDPYIQWLVNNTKIHLLPSLNPDGFEVSREGICTTSSRGRPNSRNLDLNRNFPDPFLRNTRPVQPETIALKSWLLNNSFILSASLHGGSLVANYPYDSTPEDGMAQPQSRTPDDDVFQYLARLYAKTHPTMHKGVQCSEKSRQFKDGIVNGASWYPLTGGMQDFNYHFHGCMELTLEISCCRYPPARDLKNIWDENHQALLSYISQAHRGIRGVVRDKNGQPVPKAVLRIVGRNITFNSTINGEFWRILLPDNYILQVIADGFRNEFIPFTVPEVVNETMPAHLWLEITLVPKEYVNSVMVRRTVISFIPTEGPKINNKSSIIFLKHKTKDDSTSNDDAFNSIDSNDLNILAGLSYAKLGASTSSAFSYLLQPVFVSILLWCNLWFLVFW